MVMVIERRTSHQGTSEHPVEPSPACHLGCLGCAQTSLDVLTSEEARRLYDWGVQRALRGDADDYVWPFEI